MVGNSVRAIALYYVASGCSLLDRTFRCGRYGRTDWRRSEVHVVGGKIFICYRREEGFARFLYDRLSTEFPNQVFMDVGSIQVGTDYVKRIDRLVVECAAFILVVSKRWCEIDDPINRRLHDPDDPVRREIMTALNNNVTIIPVLVGKATAMPERKALPFQLWSLATLEALPISDHYLDVGIRELIEILTELAPRPRANLVGTWDGSDGLRYEIRQSGDELTFAGYHPAHGRASVGEARLSGRNIQVTHYKTIYGAEGNGRLEVVSDNRLIGSVTDRISGNTLQLVLSR